MPEPFPLAPALWAATAPPAQPTLPLDSSARADVCVIGAGYAGLSSALALAERGVQTIVLEAREPGWGGSGRNGGQVIPGLKYDPDELETMFGPERGPRLVDFAGGAADAVFDLIARHRMDVPHTRSGWIQGAHSTATVELVKRRAGEWQRRGADVAFLDKAETDRHLGTTQYLASWIDRRGAAARLDARRRAGGACGRRRHPRREPGGRARAARRQVDRDDARRRERDRRSGRDVHQRLWRGFVAAPQANGDRPQFLSDRD